MEGERLLMYVDSDITKFDANVTQFGVDMHKMRHRSKHMWPENNT